MYVHGANQYLYFIPNDIFLDTRVFVWDGSSFRSKRKAIAATDNAGDRENINSDDDEKVEGILSRAARQAQAEGDQGGRRNLTRITRQSNLGTGSIREKVIQKSYKNHNKL